MPDELKREDAGWLHGPVVRERPPFVGHAPGPADPSLNDKSSEKEIMARLLTDQVVDQIAEFAKLHANYYRGHKLKVTTAKELFACNDTLSLQWIGITKVSTEMRCAFGSPPNFALQGWLLL